MPTAKSLVPTRSTAPGSYPPAPCRWILHGPAVTCCGPNLRHHLQEFLDWDGAAYVGVADDTVRSEVWRFLETCRVETEKAVKPLVPNSAICAGTYRAAARRDALATVRRDEPPLCAWTRRSGPDRWSSCRPVGLLHLPGDLLPASRTCFTAQRASEFAQQSRRAAAAERLGCGFLRDGAGPVALI